MEVEEDARHETRISRGHCEDKFFMWQKLLDLHALSMVVKHMA